MLVLDYKPIILPIGTGNWLALHVPAKLSGIFDGHGFVRISCLISLGNKCSILPVWCLFHLADETLANLGGKNANVGRKCMIGPFRCDWDRTLLIFGQLSHLCCECFWWNMKMDLHVYDSVTLKWHRLLKAYLREDRDMCILQSAQHGCWWPVM